MKGLGNIQYIKCSNTETNDMSEQLNSQRSTKHASFKSRSLVSMLSPNEESQKENELELSYDSNASNSNYHSNNLNQQYSSNMSIEFNEFFEFGQHSNITSTSNTNTIVKDNLHVSAPDQNGMRDTK